MGVAFNPEVPTGSCHPAPRSGQCHSGSDPPEIPSPPPQDLISAGRSFQRHYGTWKDWLKDSVLERMWGRLRGVRIKVVRGGMESREAWGKIHQIVDISKENTCMKRRMTFPRHHSLVTINVWWPCDCKRILFSAGSERLGVSNMSCVYILHGPLSLAI